MNSDTSSRVRDQLRVSSAMKPAPYTIGPRQTLKTAREKMHEHNIRHLPVQDGGNLVGVLSERDIFLALAVDEKEAERIVVKDVMSTEPYVVSPDVPMATVARRMAHDRLGCALVATDDRIEGIVTTVDALHLLAELLSGGVEQ